MGKGYAVELCDALAIGSGFALPMRKTLFGRLFNCGVGLGADSRPSACSRAIHEIKAR